MSVSKESSILVTSASLAGMPPRKKIKTSDLPISSSTRSAFEGLAHTFKKKGDYDGKRKQVWDQFKAQNFESQFVEKVIEIAEAELDRNPEQLLKLERSKAALLLEGAIERNDVYHTAEAQMNQLVDQFIPEIESMIRGIRRDSVGEEIASAEEIRGRKTDQEYIDETEAKQEERRRMRKELKDKEQAIYEEKKKLEKAKRREEERKREVEEEKRKEERDARKRARDEADKEREVEKVRIREEQDAQRRTRNAEREKENERQRDGERERERERNRSTRDRSRDEGRDRYWDDRNARSRHDDRYRDTRRESPKPMRLSEEEVKRLEAEALEDLLNEGKRASERTARRTVDLDIDDTLAPPPRKTMPASAIQPIAREALTKSSESRDSIAPKVKADDASFKIPTGPAKVSSRIDDDRGRERRRSRSKSNAYDMDDRKLEDRRSRYEETRELGSRPRSRERDDRPRRDSYDHRTGRRDRSSSPRRERDIPGRSRASGPHLSDWRDANELKVAEVKKREAEAALYMAMNKVAEAKGIRNPLSYAKPLNGSDGKNFTKEPVWAGLQETAAALINDPSIAELLPDIDKPILDAVIKPERGAGFETTMAKDKEQEIVLKRQESRPKSRSRSAGRRESSAGYSVSDRHIPLEVEARRRLSVLQPSPTLAHDKSIARQRLRSRSRSWNREREREREQDRRETRHNRSRSRSRDRARGNRDSRAYRSRSRSRARNNARDRDRSPRGNDRRDNRRYRSRSRSRDRDERRSIRRRSPSRSRERDRRDRDRDMRDTRDTERSRRNRSRSRSRDRRDRSRDNRDGSRARDGRRDSRRI